METENNKFNDIYLNLQIRKSQTGKTDEYGNYIFEVEASNENLDLQNQVVLQNALLESKDEFLRGGVISYDHLHKTRDEDGKVISDPSMIIGEPIDVKTDGKSTIVVGKLYKNNDKAKELIKMLKAGSTRVRASVGGIFPQIERNIKTGVEKITHVLWNDLALTTSPVNNTVGAAVFAKSMNPDEFVKALAAGYGTDSSDYTGGRSLIEEDVGKATVNEENEIGDSESMIINSLIDRIKANKIHGEGQAVQFLMDNGIFEGKSRTIVREIINQGRQMMKKSFSEQVQSLLKSLSGEDEDEMMKADDIALEDEIDDEEIDIDDDEIDDDIDDEDMDIEDEEEIEEDEPVKKACKKSVKKSDDDDNDDEDDEYIDGTQVMKSLSDDISLIRKSMQKEIKSLHNRLNSVVEVNEQMATILGRLANEKMPLKSVLNKSIGGKKTTKSSRPSEAEFEKVQEILIKSVQNGEISMMKSSAISSDVQRCMRTGEPMRKENFDFIMERINN